MLRHGLSAGRRGHAGGDGPRALRRRRRGPLGHVQHRARPGHLGDPRGRRAGRPLRRGARCRGHRQRTRGGPRGWRAGESIGGDAGAGALLAIYGSPTGVGVTDQLWSQDSSGVMDAAEPGDAFGSAIAIAPFGRARLTRGPRRGRAARGPRHRPGGGHRERALRRRDRARSGRQPDLAPVEHRDRRQRPARRPARPHWAEPSVGLTDDFCAPCWSVRRIPTYGRLTPCEN